MGPGKIWASLWCENTSLLTLALQYSRGSNPSWAVQDNHHAAYFFSLKSPKAPIPVHPCLNHAAFPAKAELAPPVQQHFFPQPLILGGARRAPLPTAEPLCSAQGNFPLSRPPPCNKLRRPGFMLSPSLVRGRGCARSLGWGLAAASLLQCRGLQAHPSSTARC